MNKAVNPGWFWDNELPLIVPMPSAAWARASASGPVWISPAGQRGKIYDFLAASAKSTDDLCHQPAVADRGRALHADRVRRQQRRVHAGAEPELRRPARPRHVHHAGRSRYTSQTAEFNAVRAGSVDVGYIPQTDIPQVGAVKAKGYHVFGYPGFGFNYVVYNFLDKTGHFNAIIAPAVRTAGHRAPGRRGRLHQDDLRRGGRPRLRAGPGLARQPLHPGERGHQPVPVQRRRRRLAADQPRLDGAPGGIDVCAKAGTGPGECGAGIPAGTKLAFNLILRPIRRSSEMDDDLASQAAKAGITISLKSSTFNYIITNYNNQIPGDQTNINEWAMADFGGQSISTYPTQLGTFDSTGGGTWAATATLPLTS